MKLRKINPSWVRDEILLSVEEYRKYKHTIPIIKDWWWLRWSHGYIQNNAPFVGNVGGVRGYGGTIYCDIGAVRPALQIKNHDLKIGDQFKFGRWEWTVISRYLAICNQKICDHRFDKESNNYEESEVKAIVDNDFEINMKMELSPEDLAFEPDDVIGGGTLSPYIRSNKQKVELIDKCDTVKRVNCIIAEETKGIDENSSFEEVLHAIKVLRTEIGNVIKDLPTIDFEK